MYRPQQCSPLHPRWIQRYPQNDPSKLLRSPAGWGTQCSQPRFAISAIWFMRGRFPVRDSLHTLQLHEMHGAPAHDRETVVRVLGERSSPRARYRRYIRQCAHGHRETDVGLQLRPTRFEFDGCEESREVSLTVPSFPGILKP